MVVPHKHCEIFNNKEKTVDVLNHGIKKFVASKIFYTPYHQNILMKPNFAIELNDSPVFDETIIALYDGFVLKIFGKYQTSL